MESTWNWAFIAKLAFCKFVVIELLVRQVQTTGIGFIGPTGILVRAASGTGAGVWWDFRATIGTNFRGHSKIPTTNVNGVVEFLSTGHSMPAYSSSVFRLSPMRT